MSYFIGKKITCINYKMSVEYKEKSNLIDLYGVLGLTPDVCTEPDCAELIHGAYLKKIVSLHPDKNIAVVCDLCGGEPKCVKYCMQKALIFLKPEEYDAMLSDSSLEK